MHLMNLEKQPENLISIFKNIVPKNCNLCDLSLSRTQVVPYGGNPSANIIILGEAPGREEDEQGEPFVGRSGKKLRSIVEKVCKVYGLSSYNEDFLIINTVKCRPPNNVNPTTDQMDICSRYLKQQLRLSPARTMIVLGRVAWLAMTGEQLSVTKYHGIMVKHGKYNLIYAYHPSYVLRNNNVEINKHFFKDIYLGVKYAKGGCDE